MITVHLPPDLAREFGAAPAVTLEAAATCTDVLISLDRRHPGIVSWILEPDGRFREHLSVFVSGRRLAPRSQASLALARDAEIWILRAISGG